jgi:hypothetical protein
MPTLRIKFSGLCTFVFDKQLKRGDGVPSEATVLLQRLTRARQLSSKGGAKPEILDQHFPLLEFGLADYDPASTRMADVHRTPDSSGRMTKGTCLLIGEDLAILPDGRKLERHALELSNTPPQDKAVSNLSRRERDSLWWMATLQDAFPTNFVINPSILTTPPASNQPILARVALTEGRLRTLELTEAACTIVPPPDKDFNQRVATSFEFAIPFSSTVTIKTSAIRNGKAAESQLIFKPASGGDLQIEIMNMEINRLVGLDPANGPRAEADFGVYADLLKSPPDAKNVPYLRQSSAGDPAGAPHSTCVPGAGASG